MDTRPRRKLRSKVLDQEAIEEESKEEESQDDPGTSTPDEKVPGTSTTDENKPSESLSSTAEESPRAPKKPDTSPVQDEPGDNCTCSVCDFVAKTPTALKIHAKRKHSRRGGGGHVKKADKEAPRDVCAAAKAHVGKEGVPPHTGEDNQQTAAGMAVSCQQDTSAVGDGKDASGKPPLCEAAVGSEEQQTAKSAEEGPQISPTQLLLQMVEASSAEEGPAHSQPSDAMDRTPKEKSSEHVEGQKSDPPAPTSSDTSDKTQGNKEGEEGAKKTRKRGQRPRVTHPCSHCGHEFQDKPSLATHVKRRHTKEMNHFCDLCSYACVAKCDFEKHCTSNKHKRRVAESGSGGQQTPGGETPSLPLPPDGNETGEQQGQAAAASGGAGSGGGEATPTPTPTRALKRSASGKPQLQCGSCAFRTVTPSLLESHARLKHPAEDHFHCKVCHYYTATSGGMDAHLASAPHQDAAKNKEVGASYAECVEKVHVILSQNSDNQPASSTDGTDAEGGGGDGETGEDVQQGDDATAEQEAEVFSDEKSGDGASPAKRKRGRPKGTNVTTCPHCGLVASNATNLSVHIRRRHSHQYSYMCKLCRYYCVTKGDMDRHCVTKKHVKRAEGAGGNTDPVVQVMSEEAAGKSGDIEIVRFKKVDYSQAEDDVTMTESAASAAADGEPPQQPQTSDGVEAQSNPPPKTAKTLFPTLHPRRSKYDPVNSCAHCNFVAHSIPSLELHVKRKHTKDFEFVCLACNYYAVTRREMSRHASTDKHKQKSLVYRESCAGGGGGKGDQEDAGGVAVLVAPPPTTETEETAQPSEPEAEAETEAENSETAMDQDDATTPNMTDTSSTNQGQEKPTSTTTTTTTTEEVTDGAADTEKAPEEEAPEAVKESTTTVTIKLDPVDDTEGTVTMTLDPADADADGTVTIKLDPSETEAALNAPPNADDDDLEREAEAEEGGLDECDDEEEEEEEEEDFVEGKCDDSFTDRQLVRAHPFDPCIISLKVLQEGDGADGGDSTMTTTSGGVALSLPGPLTKPKRGRPLLATITTRGMAPGQRIKCEDCGFMADGLSGLNVHISMKHPSKDKHFHCLLCGKSFYTESNLHQHLTSAAHLRNEQGSIEELPEGGATFKCVKCNEPFETEQDLFVHIKEKHEELLREVNKYVLEDTEQINREREENQGSVCKYCGKVCKSSNSMAFLAHVRTHTGSKPFSCKICNFATAQLGDARNHVKRHLGMREYKCHICGWAFVMKKHLSTHLLGKHGVGRPKERKYECDLCDRSFSERWALNNHMKLHTGDKPFKCAWPSCHYAFLTLSAMKDHYRTHTGEKSFLCDLCGFAGGTRHALTKHRRQHTGERPFRCQLCNFASTTQSHLTRHKRVHTGEKPYRCPWCDYRSNCAENIRKHILHTGKHDGVKMYNCPKCEYATNAPMEFRNHLKDTHPDIENPDLAYLHAGIVSKSFECRLKGQGATFVQAEMAFAPEDSPSSAAATLCRIGTAGLEAMGMGAADGSVQQVIIIQGYDGGVAGSVTVEQALEESAAATLQTLAMGGQVAEVLHITEDGQLISTTTTTSASSSSSINRQVLSGAGAATVGTITGGGSGGATHIQLPAGMHGATQYVLVEATGGGVEAATNATAILDASQGATVVTGRGGGGGGGGGGAEASHVMVSESASSALDALLCAVSELGHQQGGDSEEGGGGGGGAAQEAHGEEEIITTIIGGGGGGGEAMNEEQGRIAGEAAEEVQVQVASVEGGHVQVYREVLQGEEVMQMQMQEVVEEQGEQQGGSEQMGQVVTHVVGHAPSEHHHVAVGNHDEAMVQEVLQFAASQLMMKEGLTQVIVNDEGTHYIVTELEDGSAAALQLEGAVYAQSTEEHEQQQLQEVEGGGGAMEVVMGVVEEAQGETGVVVTAMETQVQEEDGAGGVERVVVYTEEAPHAEQ
ncbi:zinc finger protein 407 [Engraulis encrasicolus]|uniref:zinc finger protein 407 n=1 Tax=Engraulis encrasicolus TaxID=184585 RepID=UPI002FD05603